ncbi:MAG: 16S rRNA (cytosine(1402)-N(4))-methyltransferase RsmH [bacterium]
MYIHRPVLLKEVLAYLECADGKVYVDGTIGEGGHAEQILKGSSPTGRLIGIDLDEHILQKAAGRLERFGSRVQLIRNNFKNIKEILYELELPGIDGFLADLGISSFHLETRERGFSFQKDAPLDMRLDQRNPLTAAKIVNRSREEELARIIWEYGEERWSRKISRAIVSYRKKEVISTTGQLAEIVRSAIPARFRPRGSETGRRLPGGAGQIDPATRTFQALRIAVNQELAGLDQAIRDVVDLLNPGARICIISFHSLEDRIVKRIFRNLASSGSMCTDGLAAPFVPLPRGERAEVRGRIKVLTQKPVMATEEEKMANARARSAKLRVAEKW